MCVFGEYEKRVKFFASYNYLIGEAHYSAFVGVVDGAPVSRSVIS